MMKIFVNLFIGLLICSSLSAQTLQFSRVLTVDTSIETVPANHVWKVTSYWQSETSNTNSFNGTTCSSTSRHSPLRVNGNSYYVISSVATGSSGVIVQAVGNTFPLWLPTGTTLQTVCPGDFLSVVEFSIVP